MKYSDATMAQRLKLWRKQNPDQVKKIAEKKKEMKKTKRVGPLRRKIIKKKRAQVHVPKLRKSLVPGSVLILLNGRFRGQRVVFLKQLPKSGLLLVTGPYKINGIPLRRVNHRFVIATSTRVDVSKLKLDERISDELFTIQKRNKANILYIKKHLLTEEEKKILAEKPKEKEPEEKPKEGEGEKKRKLKKKGKKSLLSFLPAILAPIKKDKKDKKKKFTRSRVSHLRAELQKKVDDQLLPAIKKVENLGKYLKSRFALSAQDRPHLMRF